MKITAKSSGGFAGVVDCFELDTACHADGGHIEALLRRLDFFNATPAPAVGADLMRWDITADDGARCRTVTLHEGGPGGWQALIDHLRASRTG